MQARRIRISSASGFLRESTAALFEELGGTGLAEGQASVCADFAAGAPLGLEDRVEAFLHLVDPSGEAVLETAADRGPWLPGWRAIFFGADVARFSIRPPWLAPGPGIPVIVDARGAFGSGLHPSTQLALQLLDECLDRGARMLDVGAGSGVLSVAGARCGLLPTALESQPAARDACRRTAEANGVTIEIVDAAPAALSRRFPLVIANLPSSVLMNLAVQLRDAVEPGGVLIVSGTRTEQLPPVLAALRAAGRELRSPDGEWAAAAVEPHDGPP